MADVVAVGGDVYSNILTSEKYEIRQRVGLGKQFENGDLVKIDDSTGKLVKATKDDAMYVVYSANNITPIPTKDEDIPLVVVMRGAVRAKYLKDANGVAYDDMSDADKIALTNQLAKYSILVENL